jgi:glycosyltransferase involved in cell wall biosynthesis/tetratricopeptide (TPR) repeat protein
MQTTNPNLTPLIEAKFQLARAWHLKGNLERAIAGYREIITLSPTHKQPYQLLAALFLKEKQFADALEMYRQAIQYFPNDKLYKQINDVLIEIQGLDQTFNDYDLKILSVPPQRITDHAILCCIVIRNEAQRLPYLLNYYRRLGVDQFLVVDNGSTDGSQAYLLDQPDVALWQSHYSFRQANFGAVWFDLLLRKYGVGHWCLIVDADEILYYADSETLNLQELCAGLDREYKRAFTAILLDMYSDRPIQETIYQPGQDFLAVCPYFDRQVYHRKEENASPFYNQTRYIGGMRERVFGQAGDYYLNKVPLIKYLPDIILSGGQHCTNISADQIAVATGALLHFKYFASFVDYVNQEVQRQEHSNQALQYQEYAAQIHQTASLTIYDPSVSIRFQNSQQLVELGIIQPQHPTAATSWTGSGDSDSPHILIYTDCYSIYGATQWTHAIILMLLKQGYKVSSAQYEVRDRLTQIQEEAGIQHYWLEPDNLHSPDIYPRTFYHWAEPYQLFTKARPDLVLFANGGPASCLTAMEVAKDMGIPYLTVIHCVTPDWGTQFAPYLHRLPPVYEQASDVVMVSQDNLDLMHQYFGLSQLIGRVIYNGRPKSYFQPHNPQTRSRLRQAFNIPDDGIICFTAARLDPCKGYQYQVMAIQALQHEAIFSRLHFVWAGNGSVTDRLKKMVQDLGVRDHVHFLGERADVPDLLDAADIFILPSQFEGMPLAIMEAMAKGLPVIASAVSGIPEELGDTGALLPDPKVDSEATIATLTQTLKEWASQPEKLPHLGQACRDRAIDLFREEAMLEEYLALIQKTLSKTMKRGEALCLS